MGGNRAPRANEARNGAYADARHWRWLALEREEQLRALRRRPLVRLALRLDRPSSSAIGAVRGVRDRARHLADRFAVAAAAATAAPWRRRRRELIIRKVDRLEPPPPAGRRHGSLTLVGSASQPGGAGILAALASQAGTSTDELLCFLPAEDAPDPMWLDRLAAAIDGDAVAATPTLLHPATERWPATEHELLVRSAGLTIELDSSGGPIAVARGAGDDLDVSAPNRAVLGAPMSCLVVRRDAYLGAGGLESASTLDDGDLDVAALDLCVRLRHEGGRVVHVPSAVAFDHRPVAARRALQHPIDPDSSAWRWLIDREGPALRSSARPSTARSWVITTAAPSMKMAARWGDWHFGEALARALRTLGEIVTVEPHSAADSPSSRSCDVRVVLRGLSPVRRTPGQHHILWVISHPERVEPSECDDVDLVLVASARFAEELRRATTTPVVVLLQATDHHRFRPLAVDPAHQHSVTVVAKTREVSRPVVTDALAAGLRPSIYGSGWQGLVDPSLIVAERVDNAELPTVYSSAGVVLNDHWATMREWGFVSNRLFDVLACGTPVISDPIDGLDEVFRGAVPVYHTPEELGELVRCTLAQPERARARANDGRAEILANHTFDHRARTLLDLLEEHGLASMRTDTIND